MEEHLRLYFETNDLADAQVRCFVFPRLSPPPPQPPRLVT